MSIDWVTVLAQLANFLLLVWLLRRFLYRPILDGIARREAEIARRMAAADIARDEARAAEQRFVAQHAQGVAERNTMLAHALAATEQEREQLLIETRARLEQEREEWHRHLEHERLDFLQRLQRTGALVLAGLARRALHELADEELEAGIVRHVGRRLEPMAAELAAAAGSIRVATVTSHAVLDESLQARLAADLAAILPGIELRFVVDTGQSPGVVLQLGGVRVDWTIDSYMDEFERLLADSPATHVALATPGHGH